MIPILCGFFLLWGVLVFFWGPWSCFHLAIHPCLTLVHWNECLLLPGWWDWQYSRVLPWSTETWDWSWQSWLIWLWYCWLSYFRGWGCFTDQPWLGLPDLNDLWYLLTTLEASLNLLINLDVKRLLLQLLRDINEELFTIRTIVQYGAM